MIRRPPPRHAGFTLIELLAVILIIGLFAGLALPNLGLLGGQVLRDEARRLAAELELARQRTVVLGVRHQLVLDLDEAVYWTEWEVGGEAEPETDPLPGAGPLVRLSPPERELRSFEPVPSQSGRAQLLAGDVAFAGVETDTGFVERGVLTLPFELDGSSEAASVFLARPDGEEQILELEPLIEAVWVHAD